jgi:YebC/PmpR family DNA-binding regulatory protein
MSGHSKWSTIKHKKAATDAAKGKVFGRLSKKIRTAVKEGGSGDPDKNPSLRTVLENARTENMPKDKIKKAIDAGLGKGGSGRVEEIVYEGFGPNGVGFLVVAVTDNPNRTAAEIKFLFGEVDGSLGAPGSVSYMFSRGESGGYVSQMPFQVEDEKQQQQLQKLIDNLRENEDVEEVFCSAEWPSKE